MSKNFYRAILPVVLLLTLALSFPGCSYDGEQRISRYPREARVLESLRLTFTPRKVAYSPLDKTIYLLDKENNQIHFYREGRRTNTIGGLGFTESSFNRLSDITVTPNGRLLALDTFQKQIKKFDSNGMYLTNYPLSELNEPILFDISRDGTLYVYDATQNEVFIYDSEIKTIIYRFGKFQLRNPVQLNTSINHLVIYDQGNNTTFVFTQFGELVNELAGYWQIDRFSQQYRLNQNRIEHPVTDLAFHLSVNPWHFFQIKDSLIGLIANQELLISELLYERAN